MKEKIRESSTITGALMLVLVTGMAMLTTFGVPITDEQKVEVGSFVMAVIGVWDVYRRERK